jgi:outer membrane protein assembly factor BamB
VLLGDHQKTLYLLDGSDRKVLREAGRTEVDGELVSSIAGKENSAFVVADVAGNQTLLKLEVNDKVQVSGTTKLDGQVVAGPWLVGDNLFLLLDDGQLHVFNLQGESLWKLDVSNQQVAGISARGGGWDIALVTGRILRVDAAGAIQKTIEIGQPIRLAPVQAMGRVIVCAADGTLLVLNPDQL